MATTQSIASEKLENLLGLTRSRPKYELIKACLLEEFSKGNFQRGHAMPSENTLAQKLGVARNTVRQAIGQLVEEGLVKRIKGKGIYYIGDDGVDSGVQLQVFSLILPEISSGIYPVMAKGFDHQASVVHQQVLLCNTRYDINRQGNVILQMIEKNVAGVAMVPALTPTTPAFHVRQLQRHRIPVVFCHRRVPGTCAPLVTWDTQAVARRVVQTFLQKGHRQIGYFARMRYLNTEVYEDGLRQTLRDFGQDLQDACVHYGTSLQDDNSQKQHRMHTLKTMLSGKDPVSAIFCNDDNEAERVSSDLAEVGVRIPEDVSIMGFGDSHDRSGVFQSRLTSVTVDEYELGACAARVLYEMRTGRRPIDSEEVIYESLSVIEGDTVAAV